MRRLLLPLALLMHVTIPAGGVAQPADPAVVDALARYFGESEGVLDEQLDRATAVAVDSEWLEASPIGAPPSWTAPSGAPIDEALLDRVVRAVGGTAQAHEETVRCGRSAPTPRASCSLEAAELFLRLARPEVNEEEGEARVWITAIAYSPSPRVSLWVRVYELTLVESDGVWRVTSERVAAVT